MPPRKHWVDVMWPNGVPPPEDNEVKMSLTREQWQEMWNSVRYIEALTIRMPDSIARLVLIETKKLKETVQSVVGQIE